MALSVQKSDGTRTRKLVIIKKSNYDHLFYLSWRNFQGSIELRFERVKMCGH
jgi:hypothetical protein